MEYKQLTLDDWLNIKEKLRKQLQDVSEGFVRIGYQLKQIKEQRLYERDGYKDLATFAKQEYGLSATTVSRFMAINTKYSIDGNSEYLRPEFTGIGSSKLGEMLTIKDEDMALIGPETTRESIRELKRFEKDERKAEAPELSDRETVFWTIVEEFFRNQADLLNEICSDGPTPPIEEIINPSGNRTFRTGIFFVSFFDRDKGIKVKAFGQNKPESYTWDEFEYAVDNIFEFCGKDTWARHYGSETVIRKEEEIDEEGNNEPARPAEQMHGRDIKSVPEDNKKSQGSVPEDPGSLQEERTADEKPDNLQDEQKDGPASSGPSVYEDDHKPDVHDCTGDEPEKIPPEDTEIVGKEIAPAQKNGLNSSLAEESEPERRLISRRKFMEKMSTEQMARYLTLHLSTSTLKNPAVLTDWLDDLVEDKS